MISDLVSFLTFLVSIWWWVMIIVGAWVVYNFIVGAARGWRDYARRGYCRCRRCERQHKESRGW